MGSPHSKGKQLFSVFLSIVFPYSGQNYRIVSLAIVSSADIVNIRLVELIVSILVLVSVSCFGVRYVSQFIRSFSGSLPFLTFDYYASAYSRYG